MADEEQMVTPAEPASGNLELILDVPLGVSVELGRVRMPVRHLLSLSAGSVTVGSALVIHPADEGHGLIAGSKRPVALNSRELIAQRMLVERKQRPRVAGL